MKLVEWKILYGNDQPNCENIIYLKKFLLKDALNLLVHIHCKISMFC